MERDQHKSSLWCVCIISTHTLTWSVTYEKREWRKNLRFQLTRSRGAWRTSLFRKCRKAYFNSHAHVERDVLPILLFTVSGLFQLTRSRGAWLLHPQLHLLFPYFNSHAHVERDLQLIKIYFAYCIFQLTRSRGAWPLNTQTARVKLEISTHTLTWSVTNASINNFTNFCISTHTLTWSVTEL